MAAGIISNIVSSRTLAGVFPVVTSFRQDRFQNLVLNLKETLGPSSGLRCDDVNVNRLMGLMKDYDGSDNKWSKYAFGDAARGYTRNLVDEGNGKSNLVRLHGHSTST